MDLKKIAGYGVLAVGVLWLIQGSANSSSGVDTGASGSLLVGGGGLTASPTDSGFIITPPATTNYNFNAQPSPSEGFFIGANAPADPSTPSSKKTTPTKKDISSGTGGSVSYSPEVKNIMAYGTSSDYLKGASPEYAEQFRESAERISAGEPATPRDLINLGNVSAYVGRIATKKDLTTEYTNTQTTTSTPTYNWAQRTAGQAYTGWSVLTNKIKGWF